MSNRQRITTKPLWLENTVAVTAILGFVLGIGTFVFPHFSTDVQRNMQIEILLDAIVSSDDAQILKAHTVTNTGSIADSYVTSLAEAWNGIEENAWEVMNIRSGKWEISEEGYKVCPAQTEYLYSNCIILTNFVFGDGSTLIERWSVNGSSLQDIYETPNSSDNIALTSTRLRAFLVGGFYDPDGKGASYVISLDRNGDKRKGEANYWDGYFELEDTEETTTKGTYTFPESHTKTGERTAVIRFDEANGGYLWVCSDVNTVKHNQLDVQCDWISLWTPK